MRLDGVANDALLWHQWTTSTPRNRRQERLDWMYQGGVAAKQDAEKRAEDALLTGKIPDAPVDQPQGRVCAAVHVAVCVFINTSVMY